ncbi:MAG: tetratricopeptide repeat protein [Candidatus Eisenbacteria bacterium]|uniref:Tetratricopeptide repeat protein n=1 Tax=Eiseniibacteriota bacterium TaxID=2212470 RepID=A0A956NG08_UNCEI|nr:tetratricopeptide repeat protein [Candidatus Eisenbacteria bacterium]
MKFRAVLQTIALSVPVVIASGLLLSGCSASSPGLSLVETEQYDAAIPLLRKEAAAGSIESKIGLATALSATGESDEAEVLLTSVVELDPRRAEAWFRLGLIREEREDWSAAIEAYGHFTEVTPFSKLRSEMKSRIAELERRESTAWAENVVRREHGVDGLPPSPGTVTVFALEDERCPSLNGLGDAVASQLSRDLEAIGGFTLLERRRIDAILREVSLAEGGRVDDATAVRPARLLRSEAFVLGSISELGGDQIRVEMSWNRIDGTTPIVVAAEGASEQFWEVQKDLTVELLARLGRDVTPGEWALVSRSGCRNLRAFLAFGQGLEFEREARYAEARDAYVRAIEEDEEFVLARRAWERVATDPRTTKELARTYGDEEPGSREGDDLEWDVAGSGGMEFILPSTRISGPDGSGGSSDQVGDLLHDVLDDLIDDPVVVPDDGQLQPGVPGPPGPPR